MGCYRRRSMPRVHVRRTRNLRRLQNSDLGIVQAHPPTPYVSRVRVSIGSNSICDTLPILRTWIKSPQSRTIAPLPPPAIRRRSTASTGAFPATPTSRTSVIGSCRSSCSSRLTRLQPCSMAGRFCDASPKPNRFPPKPSPPPRAPDHTRRQAPSHGA